MKKVKPKVKPKKVKAKVKKMPKMVVHTIKDLPRSVGEVTGLNFGKFDEHSDWRLKEVHHDLAKVRKSLYDLSLNAEGEHDHIFKIVQRCHDRIEHVEGLVIQLTERIDDMVSVINRCGEKLPDDKKLLMSKEDTEERVRAALRNLGNDDNNDGR